MKNERKYKKTRNNMHLYMKAKNERERESSVLRYVNDNNKKHSCVRRIIFHHFYLIILK